MNELTKEIAVQAPGMAVLLVIVFAFLRYMQHRDECMAEAVEAITHELRTMSRALAVHAKETTDAVQEMHRVVRRRKAAK